MASLTALRDELQTRLATIAGLNTYDDWPDNFFSPGAIVLPVGSQPEQLLGAADYSLHLFEIVVAVTQAGGLKNAQQLLDAYTSNTGASSVIQALDGDRTLGALADWLTFGPWDRPDEEPINGTPYLGQRLAVRVWAA